MSDNHHLSPGYEDRSGQPNANELFYPNVQKSRTFIHTIKVSKTTQTSSFGKWADLSLYIHIWSTPPKSHFQKWIRTGGYGRREEKMVAKMSIEFKYICLYLYKQFILKYNIVDPVLNVSLIFVLHITKLFKYSLVTYFSLTNKNRMSMVQFTIGVIHSLI